MHHTLLLGLGLLLAVCLLVTLSQRLRLPYPMLLVLGGLGISLLPGLPVLVLNPDVIFLVFLPAVLYEAAWGDVLCYGTLLAAPGALALDASVRGHYGQVLGMYLESLVLTDALFTLAAGTVTRPRPLLYGPAGPERVRTSKVALNSFFAGHTFCRPHGPHGHGDVLRGPGIPRFSAGVGGWAVGVGSGGDAAGRGGCDAHRGWQALLI